MTISLPWRSLQRLGMADADVYVYVLGMADAAADLGTGVQGTGVQRLGMADAAADLGTGVQGTGV